MSAQITCTTCKARFRVSPTHPEATRSDAERHVVREHKIPRAQAHTVLRKEKR